MCPFASPTKSSASDAAGPPRLARDCHQARQASRSWRETKHERDRAGPIGQLALLALHAQAPLLGLEDLVGRPRLHEDHGACGKGLLALGLGHGGGRLGDRALPSSGASLLRRIGRGRPAGIGGGGVDGAGRMKDQPPGGLGFSHRKSLA